MANTLKEVMAFVATQGVGAVNVVLFRGSKADVPKRAAGTLQFRLSGGAPPINTHNRAPAPAYLLTGFQVVSRADRAEIADALLRSGYDAIVQVQNETLGSTWYVKIRPTSDIIDLGTDDRDQVQLACNFIAEHRP